MKRKCASKADKKIPKNLNNPNICCSTPPPWSNDQRLSLTLFLFLFYRRLFHTFLSKHSNPISPSPPPFPPSQSDKGLLVQTIFPQVAPETYLATVSTPQTALWLIMCLNVSTRIFGNQIFISHTQHLLYKSEYWIRGRAKLITALFIEKVSNYTAAD